MSEENQEKKALHVEIIQKMTDLATAGFGLVAALAWNDAIKGLFSYILPNTGGNVVAQFGYAIIITIIIVFITIRLGNMADLAKKQLSKAKKDEKLDKAEQK